MVGVAKKLMDKAGKEGKPWISGLFDYRVTPQSGSITSPLELMTQCTPRERVYPSYPVLLVPQKCTKLTRNSSRGRATNQKENTPRYTSLGTAQAECYMGTSNSGKPVCTKFLLDNTGKWCRATKGV